MARFILTYTYELDAEDAKEAAAQAFALTNEKTPDTWFVSDGADTSEEIVLSEAEQEDAIKRAYDGAMFTRI